MRFFRLSDDEIVVSDGKKAVLIMARGGEHHRMAETRHIELEGHRRGIVCEDCPRASSIFLGYCKECPKEVQPR